MTEKEKYVLLSVVLSATFLLLGAMVLYFDPSPLGQIAGFELLLIGLCNGLFGNIKTHSKGAG